MIGAGLTSFGLPLLTKDLIEQAARRRTYVLRVIYAVVLYGAALWVYADIAGHGVMAGISSLGRGREMFDLLVKIQFLAIIILLPGITCGAITIEKERDTLGLLLLTQLSPGAIVLEKLLSRLVAMGTYQLLSLPLFAIVYGLGGVELFQICGAIWLLAWCSAMVGAWSIYCSTWYRMTTEAFINAYVMMPVVAYVGLVVGNSPLAIADQFLTTSIPLMALSCVFLFQARRRLFERAFVPPRNQLLELFKKLDGFFEELNQEFTNGVVLVREHDTGPQFDPIAWRETRRRSLGTVRYLFRLLVVLQVPLVLAISWTVVDTQLSSFNGPTAFFLTMLWPITVLAIAVHTTNVLAAERSRQTLDVLLVTPLSARELVTQKLAGVRRLIGILSVPFATLLIFQGVWTLYVVGGVRQFQWETATGIVYRQELLGMAIATVVYPRVIQWISFHLALRLRNQTQAVLISLVAVIVICALPYAVASLIANQWYLGTIDPRIDWMRWPSPLRVLFHRQIVEEATQRYHGNPPGGIFSDVGLGIHGALFVGLWILLRSAALRSFSTCVGRTESSGETA